MGGGGELFKKYTIPFLFNKYEFTKKKSQIKNMPSVHWLPQASDVLT